MNIFMYITPGLLFLFCVFWVTALLCVLLSCLWPPWFALVSTWWKQILKAETYAIWLTNITKKKMANTYELGSEMEVCGNPCTKPIQNEHSGRWDWSAASHGLRSAAAHGLKFHQSLSLTVRAQFPSKCLKRNRCVPVSCPRCLGKTLPKLETPELKPERNCDISISDEATACWKKMDCLTIYLYKI